MTPEDIKYFVVHCSKTPVRLGDGFNVVERKCRLRGALSCGYHYVISRDGVVETGRGLDEAGNHTLGYNAQSLSICLVGMPGRATPKQREALRTLLSILQEQFPGAQAVTHAELQPNSGRGCPGFKL
ncbi:MAG: N-acetylmuramoyl-L-alanine amidase [Planctomycetaceae bacterium]|nr:N-acetylmuramoyl-L-alanine amidase [Planctomycetaceae bacterium]